MDADVVVVGAGLAGLVAAAEAPTPAAAWSWSTRRASSTWAARRSGAWAGCSSSTAPSSAGWAIKDSLELARQDWLGRAQFDRDGGPLAAGVGRGVRRLRRRREAVVAARDGPPAVPGRRLGRARRRPGRRPRQLGAAVPPHLGHRAGRGRAVRTPGPRGTSRRAGSASLPAPGGRAGRRRRARSSACAGTVLEPTTRRAGSAEQPRGRVGEFELRAQAVIVTSGGIGGNHDLVRKAWPDAARHAAEADGRRRAGPRRRPDAADHRRRPARTSSTPTGCGTTSRACATGTRSGTTTASGSCPARRRCGWTRPAAGCPRRTSRASTPSARSQHLRATGYDYSWFVLTQKIIEKEFALSGLRAEPRPDRQGHQAAAARA